MVNLSLLLVMFAAGFIVGGWDKTPQEMPKPEPCPYLEVLGLSKLEPLKLPYLGPGLDRDKGWGLASAPVAE
jgi:hypothetical protein